MQRNFPAVFAVVALSFGAASADILTFTNSSVDDSFTAYISTSNSTLGTEFYSGSGIETPNKCDAQPRTGLFHSHRSDE